jgi:hypothetical protein
MNRYVVYCRRSKVDFGRVVHILYDTNDTHKLNPGAQSILLTRVFVNIVLAWEGVGPRLIPSILVMLSTEDLFTNSSILLAIVSINGR